MAIRLLQASLPAALGLAIVLGCGGSSRKGASPAARPGTSTPARTASPGSPGSGARLLVEPRSATVVAGGILHFTTLKVEQGRRGELTELYDRGAMSNATISQGDAGGVIQVHQTGGPNGPWGASYQAPGTPGTYALRIQRTTTPVLEYRFDLKVEHRPAGREVVLEQRTVQVTAGRTVILTASTAQGAAIPPNLRTRILEENGGTLSSAKDALALYTAPAEPGTYHVGLLAGTDSQPFDQVEINVVAP